MRLLVPLLLALALPAYGQVYKWTDADGNVHFGNQPPPGEQEGVHIRESQPGAFGSERRRQAVEMDEPKDPLEPDKQRRSFSTSLDEDPFPSSDLSRSCNYAKSVLQSYENKLARLLQQGYKQYERQRAES